MDLAGSDSNAELARLLEAPVVLVIDTNGMTRGIAPLLLGYIGFDPAVNIAGVILNKVGGARHESKLRAAVEAYTDLPVIGAVWRDARLDIGERHLGLTTPAETGELARMIDGFAEAVAGGVDLDALTALAASAPPLTPAPPPPAPEKIAAGLRIAIARDESFGFYYPDDLEKFETLGATLVPFDALRDTRLPEADGLFIGGGFPEMQLEALGRNTALRADIRRAIDAGLPAYAECGGLMYLCEAIEWRGESAPMVGLIPGRAVMHDRPQGRGHVEFVSNDDCPWKGEGCVVRAHEFHYASIEGLPPDTVYVREMRRGTGIDGRHDGILIRNTIAGFAHLRNSANIPWVPGFLDFVARCRRGAGAGG